jgi:glycosyltransferase involved in cell wall biosynthesis
MENISLSPQWKVYGNTDELQKPYNVSVVIPSIGRKEIIKAISSIFEQNVNRIQILIGIDKPKESLLFLDDFLESCPKHITVNIFYPGYSTSVRHGGITLAQDGGDLRSTLTQLANSKYVAYLDDDNWWESTHLSDLLAAIKNKAWAFSLRYFVHPDSKNIICIDEWESVGPGKGIFLQKFGGFVDPNCLIIDKELCWQCISLWNIPLNGDLKGMSADRNVFNFLKNHSAPGVTGKANAFYVLDPNDGLHNHRLSLFGENYHKALSI